MFPIFVDGEGYNSFRRHFSITLTTFRTIVTRLEIHQAFTLDASNATPALKQIAIVLWRKWNWNTTRNKPSNFTDRFLEAILDLEQGRIIWPRGSQPKIEGFWTDVFPYLVDGEGYNSFRRHFSITLTTFRTIVTRLETHQAFTLDLHGNKLPLYYDD
ncbi:3304_t:CDS:2 [Funneliformis caledonium]|uniref:3304_t:CDS:1 n=1 Tax=Funneliformis caledonium TaxID=1117310 RepID=A0A9N8YSY3_9GLOM|nr:3304_t:CDS:2 [Funneliformis caledonium]